ncbi:hypothetical protein H9P43_004130 [Blastocladiella emersonii ATCC 22665]|nr:hypothetical protein H9P43_004130 [Blastocladiella emersonii ATCC 22665]
MMMLSRTLALRRATPVAGPALAAAARLASVRGKATAVSETRASASPPPPSPRAAAAAAAASAELASALPYESIPRVPAYPLVGSMPAILKADPTGEGKQFFMALTNLAAEYGPLYRVRLPGTPGDTVVVADPDMIAQVFRADALLPLRAPLHTWVHYREKYQYPLGVPFTNGEEWRRLRTAIQDPIFKPQQVQKSFCDVINPATARAVDLVDELVAAAPAEVREGKEQIALDDLVMRWTIDSVSEIILGRPFGSLNDPPNAVALRMINAVNSSFATTGEVLRQPEWAWKNQLTSSSREHFRALEDLTSLAGELMQTTFTECARDPAKLKGTFLGYLLSKDKELSRQEMLSTCIDLLFAGIDTTARSTLFCLNLLGRNPDAQQKLRDELLRVVGPAGTPVSPEHLNQLKYMRNVIKETMRIYPVAPINSRTLGRDTNIGGFRVPAGTQTQLLTYATSHDPKYIRDPAAFIPERWDTKEVHPFASLPFGNGARMCVGRRVAEMEMTVFIAHLLRRYQVTPSPPPSRLEYSILIYTKDPMPLSLRPIQA